YAHGHKVNRFEERQLGLARMKRDRYVARQAGAPGGALRTPLVTLAGDRITVNAAVRPSGELRVRLLDPAGQPLPGFDPTDGEPSHGDSVAHPVRWQRPLAAVARQPVQLEFQLRDTSLYAFTLG